MNHGFSVKTQKLTTLALVNYSFVTLVDFPLKNEAEEWAEYEEKKLDYTNLKIDTLKLDEEPDPNDDGDDVNEDGEKVKKSKEGGPWSKLVASDSIDKDEDDEKTPGNLKCLFINTLMSKTKLKYSPWSC